MKNVNSFIIPYCNKIINSKIFVKVLYLTIIIININNSNCQNSTTCYEMYSNKTIVQNCFNSTACCFLNYTYYNTTSIKCIEKINSTENICPGIDDISYKEGATLNVCDCAGNFIAINFLIFFIIILYLI